VRHLWKAYEAVRMQQDRNEVERPGRLIVRVADQKD
jgi:hypothetical protein